MKAKDEAKDEGGTSAAAQNATANITDTEATDAEIVIGLASEHCESESDDGGFVFRPLGLIAFARDLFATAEAVTSAAVADRPHPVAPHGPLSDEAILALARDHSIHSAADWHQFSNRALLSFARALAQRPALAPELAAQAAQAPPSAPVPQPPQGWRPIESAPKDGTLLQLLIEHGEESDCGGGFEDEELTRTIGFNNGEHDGKAKP